MFFNFLFGLLIVAPIALGAIMADAHDHNNFGIGERSFTSIFIPHSIYWLIMFFFSLGVTEVYHRDSDFAVSKANAEKNLVEYRKIYEEGKDNKILAEAIGAKIIETEDYLTKMQKHQAQKIEAKKDAEKFRERFPFNVGNLVLLAGAQFLILLMFIPGLEYFIKVAEETQKKAELDKKESLSLDKVDPFAPFWEVGDKIKLEDVDGSKFTFLSAERNKVWLENESDKKVLSVFAYRIECNETFEKNRKADLLRRMSSESEYMMKLAELKNLINLRELT